MPLPSNLFLKIYIQYLFISSLVFPFWHFVLQYFTYFISSFIFILVIFPYFFIGISFPIFFCQYLFKLLFLFLTYLTYFFLRLYFFFHNAFPSFYFLNSSYFFTSFSDPSIRYNLFTSSFYSFLYVFTFVFFILHCLTFYYLPFFSYIHFLH